jgi:hypothetical protein
MLLHLACLKRYSLKFYKDLVSLCNIIKSLKSSPVVIGKIERSVHLYSRPWFSTVPFTIVLISGISTLVNGTLLNFSKRYKDNLSVIFDQWQMLHLGLDALSNQKILKGIYRIQSIVNL